MLDASFSGLVEAAARRWDVPAVALGVAVGGDDEVVALGCDGDTLFRIASITKPFTAMLALELLSLEARSGIWAPDVRVRHLLSHTSGYASEIEDWSSPGRVAEQLPHVRRWLGAEQVWSYSNVGYTVTGLLCAAAAGAGYEDALDEHVIRPLGLDATRTDVPPMPAGAVPHN